MISEQKEVYFHKYCPTCEHKDNKEHEKPCDDCLEDTVNTYSHKPTKYKEREQNK